MTPIRTEAPDGPLVSVADLKAHLRVDGDHDDSLIEAYERAALAHLDGWRGVLGRCVQSQKWTVTFDEAGRHRLPFPDVTEVVAVNGNGNPVEVQLCPAGQDWSVRLTAPAMVTMTTGLPEDALEAVVMAVKLLVGHWYLNREAVSERGVAELPLSVTRLLAPVMVWRV